MEAALEQDATVYQYDEVRAGPVASAKERERRLLLLTCTALVKVYDEMAAERQRADPRFERLNAGGGEKRKVQLLSVCDRHDFCGFYWKNGFSLLLSLFFPVVPPSFQSKYIDSLMKAATDRKKLEDVRLAHKVRRAWCARGLPVWLPCRHYC